MLSRFSIQARLHPQRQKDASPSEPVAQKEAVFFFFFLALCSPAAPATADVLDSHTEAAVVIFRL